MLLRQHNGEGLSPPPGTAAPRGAPNPLPSAPAGSGPRAGRAVGGSSASDAQTSADAVRCAAERAGDLVRCAAVSDGAEPAAMAAAVPISADRRPGRCSHDTTTSPAGRGTSPATDG